MGEVYRARDTRLGREVAIKILPAAFAESEDRRGRFEREARAISQLSHPNICTIYQLGRIEEASQYYAKALKIKPGDEMARKLMASVDMND